MNTTTAETQYGKDWIEALPTIVLDTFTSVHHTDTFTNVHYGKFLSSTPDGFVYFDISGHGFTGPYVRETM